MTWDRNEAERLCGDLLQALINALPSVNWERAGAREDDGIIYFTNTKGNRVCVVISREALEDYRDADERSQYAKEQRLAAHFARIAEDNTIAETIITSDQLPR